MCDSRVYSLKKLAETYPRDKGFILDVRYDSQCKETDHRYFMVKGINRSIEGLQIDAVEVEVLS